MWINPSSSSSRRANAPNLVKCVILPSISSPSLRCSTFFTQGSCCNRRVERPMRLRSRSILITCTCTSCPTLSTSLGCFMRSQDNSERCTSPSAPSIFTKAPKSAMLVTRPVRISPSDSSSNKRSFSVSRVSCNAARSDRIRRRRSRSTSITREVIVSPTISPQRCSGVSPLMSARRRKLICDAGTKPRSRPKGTSNPPLL